MSNVNFDIESIEYLYIFDYYDFPLSFITKKINGKYYFFYYLDFETYFVKALSIKDINLIFSDISTRSLLENFYNQEDFFVLYKNKNNQYDFNNISVFEIENNIRATDYFPENDSKFQQDFITNRDFETLCREYTSIFSDLFDNKELTVKLVDRYNSHSASANIVIKTINLLNTFMDSLKLHLNESNIFTNENMVLKPFTPGSFNINFELVKSPEVSFFENDAQIYFDDFIVFIDSLNSENVNEVYEDLIFEDAKIVKELGEYYSLIKANDISVSIENNHNKLSEITVNEQTDNFINSLQSLTNKLTNSTEIVETFNFEGTVESASNARNHITVRTISGSIKAKFSKAIFNDIKKLNRTVSISSIIQGQWIKRTYLDGDENIIDTKYEIVEFRQSA